MEKKSIKRALIIALVFTCISCGNIMRLKGIENLRAIHIVSLLTLGIGKGALLVTFFIMMKHKGEK